MEQGSSSEIRTENGVLLEFGNHLLVQEDVNNIAKAFDEGNLNVHDWDDGLRSRLKHSGVQAICMDGQVPDGLKGGYLKKYAWMIGRQTLIVVVK